MKIAVVDSGVAIPHSHIGPVAGGIGIGEGGETEDFTDRIGHGTAVMAAIMEKAPAAEYLAVRVFHRALRTKIEYLVRAIEWSLEQRADLINLSLGTDNQDHALHFLPLIERGAVLVAPANSIPGSLPGGIAVHEDRDCPRDQYRRIGEREFAASPYPRPIPGVAPERNLNGISFAVANMTGFLARDPDLVAALKTGGRDSSRARL